MNKLIISPNGFQINVEIDKHDIDNIALSVLDIIKKRFPELDRPSVFVPKKYVEIQDDE